MARILRKAERHVCFEELVEIDMLEGLFIGTIVECSCKKQYCKSDDQREGVYWREMKKSEYVTGDEIK